MKHRYMNTIFTVWFRVKQERQQRCKREETLDIVFKFTFLFSFEELFFYFVCLQQPQRDNLVADVAKFKLPYKAARIIKHIK